MRLNHKLLIYYKYNFAKIILIMDYRISINKINWLYWFPKNRKAINIIKLKKLELKFHSFLFLQLALFGKCHFTIC